jgi:tetratricopeptide (TPR) repeat protein
MIFPSAWFDTRATIAVGIDLADQLASVVLAGQTASATPQALLETRGYDLVDFLEQMKRATNSVPLNLYKKVKLALAFRQRLAERGIDRRFGAEATRALVLRLLIARNTAAGKGKPASTSRASLEQDKSRALMVTAGQYMGRGEFGHAIIAYKAFLKQHPRDACALNYLGAALGNLGRYQEAEECFRQSVRMDSTYAEAWYNLGSVLRARSQLIAAEQALRHAIQLKPDYTDALTGLGLILIALGCPRDAKPFLKEALRLAPAHSDALLGMGQIASMEGRFGDAESLFKGALQADQSGARAWASLASLRRMSSSDRPWLERAERILSSGLPPMDEVNLHFAMGKFCDDVSDFQRAFRHYKRGNDILRSVVPAYRRDAHVMYVDDLIRVYTRGALALVAADSTDPSCTSSTPVLVVGMPRSGTSLIEQIIASHPVAAGAGELRFWTAAVNEHEEAMRRALPPAPLRRELASKYLQALTQPFPDARRIVDKAPINSDYLGVIYSVLPNARMIHVRRDPIDTCLSCYFQQFSTALRFTMDLGDLAHYYRQHHRLMVHWHTVLPPGTVLEVPYAQLVTDPRAWISRILEFIGLGWDERCLNFQTAERAVATGSAWQVRQKIYTSSLERWRNYEQFLGPLLELRELEEGADEASAATA